MRTRLLLCLLGTLAALSSGALAAGIDIGTAAVLANAALIYGLAAIQR